MLISILYASLDNIEHYKRLEKPERSQKKKRDTAEEQFIRVNVDTLKNKEKISYEKRREDNRKPEKIIAKHKRAEKNRE